MTDEILKYIDDEIQVLSSYRDNDGNLSFERLIKSNKALRVAVEEIARVPACDSNSCTTCDVIAEIAKILGVESEK